MDVSVTDERLIAAIKRDDYVSYNQLFVRYYNRLCCYAYRILMDKEDTEDVIQELFLTLWKNRSKIEIEGTVASYLYKMAKNLSLNYIRSKMNYKTLLENQENTCAYYEENQFESEEFRVILYDCIDRLPGRCKEVLLLHRVKGLKQKEIADQLSISVKTIKNQIWSSLQKIKKCMELKGA